MSSTTEDTAPPTAPLVTSSAEEAEHHIIIQITCCKCIHQVEVTPARLYLCDYYTKLIGLKKEQEKKTERRRIKPMYSGEALTENDIFDRLEDEDQQKQENAGQKEERANKKREEKQSRRLKSEQRKQ